MGGETLMVRRGIADSTRVVRVATVRAIMIRAIKEEGKKIDTDEN